MAKSEQPAVLVVEDDASLRRIAEFNLSAAGYRCHVAADGEEGLARFREIGPDLTIADLAMPKRDGLSLLSEIRRLDPGALVIMITAFGTVERAVEAMRRGAFDFVTKPLSWDALDVVIQKALEHHRLAADNARLRAELGDRFRPENMVGVSAAMQEVFRLVGRVATSDLSVLVLGESGTGKELVARAIHTASARRAGPFVAVNCGALPRDLIESELFGFEKGAFSGAHRARRGRFEQADGGSLFLDEVVDLPVDLQVKLLRVLQEREVDRLGGQQPIPVDVRVIAATNAALGAARQQGRLREDLYYRLNAVTIVVPPLRERSEDIPALVERFLQQAAAREGGGRVELTGRAMAALLDHAWPGNVRELENVVARALLMRRQADRVDLDDLPHEVRAVRSQAPAVRYEIPPGGVDINDVERELIEQALERTRGNRSQAAKLLGMSRQTLLYRMKKHGIED